MMEYRDDVVNSPLNMDIPLALRMSVLNLPQKFLHEKFLYIKVDSKSSEYTSLADMGIMSYLKRSYKHTSIQYRYTSDFCKGRELLIPLCCLELERELTPFDLREVLQREAHNDIQYHRLQLTKSALKKFFKKFPKLNDAKKILETMTLFDEYLDSEGKFSAYDVLFNMRDCKDYILEGLKK